MQHELAKLSDIPATGSLLVPFFGREVHVFFAEGEARAVANACTHIGGPLECRDGIFTCPWHGATFRWQRAPALTARHRQVAA